MLRKYILLIYTYVFHGDQLPLADTPHTKDLVLQLGVRRAPRSHPYEGRVRAKCDVNEPVERARGAGAAGFVGDGLDLPVQPGIR